jgi:hypothetical protein
MRKLTILNLPYPYYYKSNINLEPRKACKKVAESFAIVYFEFDLSFNFFKFYQHYKPLIKMAKDYLGKDMRKGDIKEQGEEKEIKSLDEGDIALLKSYGQGQYSKALKQVF